MALQAPSLYYSASCLHCQVYTRLEHGGNEGLLMITDVLNAPIFRAFKSRLLAVHNQHAGTGSQDTGDGIPLTAFVTYLCLVHI